jgi:Domain of unknown function (DUF4863)
MSRQQFDTIIATITDRIGEAPLDADLEALLNGEYPADGETFEQLTASCRAGVEEGWLCGREHGGIKFGRVVEAGTSAGSFSVDVVEMNDVKGPYHRHPNGEIDAVMPLDASAEFDGRSAGWMVYGADSAHYPTVSGGKALVLYLLPDGAIDFKAKPPA